MHTISPGTRWRCKARRYAVYVDYVTPRLVTFSDELGTATAPLSFFLAFYQPAPTVWQRLQAWARGAGR